MKKKKAKTARKVSIKKTAKKVTSGKKEMIRYTYDTPMSVVERQEGFDSGMPPDTKLGDYLEQNGLGFAASILFSAKF